MNKILILDSEPAIAALLAKSLEGDYRVLCCPDSGSFAQMAMEFQPRLLVVDLSAPGDDMIRVLQGLFMCGYRGKIVASSRFVSDYVVEHLQQLGASCLLTRPCTVNALLQPILDIMLGLEAAPGNDMRKVANELLLQLGFRMDLQGYKYLLEAVLYTVKHPDCAVTTELYPDIAKLCNGTSQQAEKAIRDCVHKAWDCRDERIWHLYFPVYFRKKKDRLTSGVFLKRIAYAVADYMEYSHRNAGTA